MAYKTEDDEDADGEQGRGCIFLIGAIILALCIGTAFGEVAGWAVLGILLIIMAIGGK